MEKKYRHHVSYMSSGNSTGCMQILSDLKEYKTGAEIEDLTKFIKEQNNVQNLIVTNILTFKR